MEKFLFLLSFATLTGCAIGEDVTLKSKLYDVDRQAVESIRSKSVVRCSIVYHDAAAPNDPSKNLPGGTKIVGTGKITRLFLAPEGWYKALVTNQGIMDYVYYQPDTDKMVCGQQLWDGYANTAGIRFIEVGSTQRPSL